MFHFLSEIIVQPAPRLARREEARDDWGFPLYGMKFHINVIKIFTSYQSCGILIIDCPLLFVKYLSSNFEK